MVTHLRRHLIWLAILLVVMAALLLTTRAYAQDEQPLVPESTPAPAIEEVAPPPADPQLEAVVEPALTNPAPLAEPAPTETASILPRAGTM